MTRLNKLYLATEKAVGDSYGLGKNSSRHHYDALVDKVTLRAKGKYIAKEGKFLI